MTRTAKEEELMIEIERLKAWIGKIMHEAWKGTDICKIEYMAEKAIMHSSCVIHTDFEPCEDWAALGVWPPKCGEAL